MSEIKVDDLTGKTSAGDITVTSEGGAATMQLQQGLAKCWVNFNGTGTIAARDSLNLSSLTDNATSDYTINPANALANANYCGIGNGWESGGYTSTTTYTPTTSSLRVKYSSPVAANADSSYVNTAIHGDLA
jgi:hypothetical protein